MLRPLLFLLLAVPAFAQAPPRDHQITLEDYGTLATIRELAISPDGKFVAYTEARWDKADDSQKTDLWLVATDGKGKPTRLTFDRANDRHPKWSADGKAIYVLGNRKSVTDGKTQVWRVPVNGGDPRAITKLDGGITGYDYAPKADSIYCSVDLDTTDKDDFSALRSKHKAEYGHGVRKISEIHRLDLQSWHTEKQVADNRYVREFAVTQDGKRIAMVSCIDDTVLKSEGESRVDIWEAGKVTTPPTDVYRKNPKNSEHAWLENLVWIDSGNKLAFTAVHDAFPAEVITIQEDYGELPSKTGKPIGWYPPHRIDRKSEWEVVGYGRALGNPLSSIGSESLLILTESKGKTVLRRYHWDSQQFKNTLPPIENVHAALIRPSHTMFELFAILSSSRVFPTLHNVLNDESLADPNPQSATWKLPTVEHVTWKAPDGTEVGGVLELPPGYKKGDKLPLVVGLHGGPTTSSKAELSYDPHNGRLYFAAHGYAAFFPNYRGSTGYGDKFVTDLIGRENDIEVKDIIAGIQHLIKEGIADPDRIGVMGWSNGGYLTNCLISLKDSPIKFKAASSGAGILETTSQWGMNDEPAYMKVFKNGLPWEMPEAYHKASPLYGLGNVTTPTLIHVGGNDERCPPGQSKMLYRALKEYRKVPTEFITYPNQPHGLTKLSNRIAKMEWDLAWFDKYVKNAK